MIYDTKSPKETQEVAGFLLENFLNTERKKALVIALEGELGVGKTTFVQGLAMALGIQAKIKSPTFTLMKSYELRATSYKLLYHLDCYRLRDHKDLSMLGIKEILGNPKNIVLIEWSDIVKKILPKKHIKVHIDHIDKNKRRV